MNIKEYNKIKKLNYNEYCNYLQEKYGPVPYIYGSSKNRDCDDVKGLFIHHIAENKVASLCLKENQKLYPEYQKPEYLVYADYLEHCFLHILIGEETAGSKNLGLHGDNLFIIPALRCWFEEGRINNSKMPSIYFDRIKDDREVYDLLFERYNKTVENCDIVIDYNRTLYLQTERCLQDSNKALVVLGTGLGKTTTALQYLWEHQCRGFVIGPNNLIKSGWEEYGEWVDTTTYQTFANTYKDIDYSQYGLIIIDEAHHAGYDAESDRGAAVWAQGIDYVISNNIKLLGLTATPIRSDGIDIGETLFKDCVCEGYAVEDAIEKNIIHPFSYITAIYDTSSLVNEIKEKYYSEDEECKKLFGQLDLAVNNTPTIKDIFTKYMPNNKRKGIIFIQEIEDKEYVLNIFKQIYPNKEFRAIDSHMNPLEVENNRQWFEQTDEGYLIAVNMISEGAHYPGVNTLIMFRRTDSYLVYTQQLGRIITLTKDENPKAIVFDLVNNIENIRYNDRKLNKKRLESHTIYKIIEALKKVKSEQIIIADETRNIVDSIRNIKNNYTGKLTHTMRKEIDLLYEQLGSRNLQKLFKQKYNYLGSHDLIELYAREHNLVYLNKRCRKEEDMLKIKELHNQGLNYKEIAKEMSLTYSTVQSRLRAMGLQNKADIWSPEELLIGEKYYAELGPYKLHELYLPNRTIKQITYQAARQKWYRNKDTYKINKRCKKIRCIETGIIYNSNRQASIALGLDEGAISRMFLKNLKSCGGYHWEYVEE